MFSQSKPLLPDVAKEEHFTSQRGSAKHLFVVGVGPGSAAYLTEAAIRAIRRSKFIIGYRYTLSTIQEIIDPKEQQVFEVSMKTQDQIYLDVYNRMEEDEFCAIPFTGDANFSESEVVDRLLEIFGEDNVEIIPGISSIQVAAAKAKVPIDKALVVTFHVTGKIDTKKSEMLNAVLAGKSVIVLPRPWPADPEKNFMPADIAKFLRTSGVNTSKLKALVFEHLTTSNENVYRGTVASLELESKKFSDLSVLVIDQSNRQTYLEFDP